MPPDQFGEPLARAERLRNRQPEQLRGRDAPTGVRVYPESSTYAKSEDEDRIQL
ncbi:hypothetical protein [Streptomyces sp. BpilaLS-43]|uniref:hypothetical protein n=1 Tax=Streptomyces sp. BpilaLS-43 TaxID=1839778 RepID=UPI00159F0F54|nr:hypothetical protein [Streptomyces sp. BpilaLS-43]